MKSGWAVWITGLPASGKSTIARRLAAALEAMEVTVQVLESDALRTVLTPRPSYSTEEREIFYNAMIHIGFLLSSNGVNVIFDATAHCRRWREKARETFPRFLEVFVDTPLEVCAERDPKGIYRKADRGEAETVPGKQLAYEAPESPEIRVDGASPPEKAVKAVLEAMRSHGFDLPFLA
ncbi:MAG: adenylyl-sulfate kinase [Deltaproteobacteria bacterium]|nr:adenylyl-sulfate kinase [Deltaproteobacteria bacterium]